MVIAGLTIGEPSRFADGQIELNRVPFLIHRWREDFESAYSVLKI